jgi:outer membrane protein assembly factor BamB
VLVACAAAIATAAAIAPAQDGARRASEDPQEVRSFALPDTRAARATEASVEGHIAAHRWSEALNDLQTLLEDQRGDVLPGSRALAGGARRSQQPVHVGAAERARRRLFQLPNEARVMYRERHEIDAQAALAAGRSRMDRRALAEVARRWPLTRAAEQAWWALGDLELEEANATEALEAWSRALACALGIPELALRDADQWTSERVKVEQSDAASPGVLRRIDFAVQYLRDVENGKSALAPEGDARRTGDAQRARGVAALPPGRESDAWPERVRLPQHPFSLLDDRPPWGGGNLFAARSGETLLVSTSLRLLALNAYSGALIWDSDEPPGWSELADRQRADFFKGIDRSALIAPAASAHVAIAALQIPVAFISNESFQQTIPITTIIPDRRLFAFDVATGRKLWDQTPPPLWDGESGGFTQRMSVAGPPVIAGARVIAPFCRMQGRIDYHVGCFDLDSGELLWSTSLISGQRELNMFGRALGEFCAPAVRVVDDRVIALTQLGAIASLDLFTGEILWETTYEQITLHPNHDFTPNRRPNYWKNTGPVIAGNTVLCTPFDSRELIGLDIDTGAMLWSLEYASIAQACGVMESELDLLIGVRDNTVYLGGSKIVALEARGGLHEQAPTTPRWQRPFDDEDMRNPRPGRAVLFGDRILVPTLHKRIDIDVQQGRAVSSLAWADRQSSGEGHGGNLLVSPGEMFTVSSIWVDGYFEWDVLVTRARKAFEQHPEDTHRALALGQLLSNRSEGEWQRGQTENARAHLADAEAVLKRGLAAGGGDELSTLKSELHVVLRRSARVHADLADASGALRSLREAEGFAGSRENLRETLLEELALLRNHDTPERNAAWSRALDELERSCKDLTVMCDSTPGADAKARGGPSRFTPLVGSAAKSDAVPFEMPVGLFVICERAAAFAASGDRARLFAELHRALELYADVELPTGSAGEWASESIAGLLASGRRDGYEAFEARARQMFEDASQRNDKEALARVARLYPHSFAAQAASDVLLDLAVRAGDAASAMRIVSSELPSHWRLAEATARDVRLLARAASVMRKIGNPELADELLRTLAEERPDLAAETVLDDGSQLAALARGIARWTEYDTGAAASRFAPTRSRALVDTGEQEFLGFLAPELGAPLANGARALFARAQPDRHSAWLSAAWGDSVQWKIELPSGSLPPSIGASYWSHRAAFARSRIVLAAGDSVVGLNAADGERAWEWHPPGGTPDSMSVACASGVAVVVARFSGGRYVVQALDAHAGVELWREGMLENTVQAAPLLSSNQVVFPPVSGGKQFVVCDLFTGRRALQFEIDLPAAASVDQDAWIEGGRLIVPWFDDNRSSARNQILALDLANGRTQWRLGFSSVSGDSRALSGILQHGAKTYLLVAPATDAQPGASPRAILELSTAIGAASPLANIRIGPEDRILGLPRERASRVHLATSWFFVLSGRSGARDARLRAVDLESGEQWTHGLDLSIDEIATRTPAPLPALSDSTVAIAYTLATQSGTRNIGVTQLSFFDRATGSLRDRLDLDKRLGASDNLLLVPLESALIVKGQRLMEFRR